MTKYPQVLLNVRVAQRFDPMASPEVLEVVRSLERRLNGRGRIVLRASGTEPLIRVMVEGHEAKMVKARRPDDRRRGRGRGGQDRRNRARRPLRDLQLPVHAANLRRLSRKGAFAAP